jgi:hypothetical protein
MPQSLTPGIPPHSRDTFTLAIDLDDFYSQLLPSDTIYHTLLGSRLWPQRCTTASRPIDFPPSTHNTQICTGDEKLISRYFRPNYQAHQFLNAQLKSLTFTSAPKVSRAPGTPAHFYTAEQICNHGCNNAAPVPARLSQVCPVLASRLRHEHTHEHLPHLPTTAPRSSPGHLPA